MILITGGRAQGKRAFWEKNIASGEGEPSEISGLWIRGGQTSFDECLDSPYVKTKRLPAAGSGGVDGTSF